MLSIQAAGNEILNNNPGNFYIFSGVEYGIKRKYIEILKSYYQNRFTEYDSLSEVLVNLKKKHLIHNEPQLYIVRYDEDFIRSLNESTKHTIENLKDIGTIVCIYELDKYTSKCNKYLSDYTVAFNHVDKHFIKRYLKNDFPEIDDMYIDYVLNHCNDYNHAYNICHCLDKADKSMISGNNLDIVSKYFGIDFALADQQFRFSFASRNFKDCLNLIDNYNGELSNLYYTMISVLLELEKLQTHPKMKADLNEFSRYWNTSDIYNMFMNVYNELECSRNLSVYNIYDRLIYLVSLLKFMPVPNVEVLL